MIIKERPINLNLRNIKFPLTAIASITHRISGIIIFIITGIFLWILKLSLSSTENFFQAKFMIHDNVVKYVIWITSIFFIYHCISGIRHILMDIGILNKRINTTEQSVIISFILTGILSIFFGTLLW